MVTMRMICIADDGAGIVLADIEVSMVVPVCLAVDSRESEPETERVSHASSIRYEC